MTQLVGVPAGFVEVGDEVNGGCPGTLLPNGNVSVPNVCVTTPYPRGTSNFSFSVKDGDRIEIAGQIGTVHSAQFNSLIGIHGAVVDAPFDPVPTAGSELVVLTDPGTDCFSSSSLGDRLSIPDCRSQRIFVYDLSGVPDGGVSSAYLHFVRAADDAYTLDSSGRG